MWTGGPERTCGRAPRRRARRRLLELLVQTAHSRLLPPRIVTESELPELLYEPKRPFASPFVQQQCWVEAIRRLSPALTRALTRELPRDDDVDGWMRLGRLLWRLHRELAAERLGFAEAYARARDLAHLAEHRRWKCLMEAQAGYLRLLDEAGVWDRETARIVALDAGECRIARDIRLVGTVDLNRVTRDMLDHVADRVSALIPAPEALAHRFDEHGCVLPAAWQSVSIDLPEEQIHVVDGPRDQVQEVVRALHRFGGRYRADEVTIGVADELLVPRLRRTLSRFQVPTRWAVGKSLPESLVFKLLDAVASYVEELSPANFAALVRHPDVSDWVQRRGIEPGWLTELDDYLSEHLPVQLGQWLGPARSTRRLRRVHRLVTQLLADLKALPQPLVAWTKPILRLIRRLIGEVDFDPEDTWERAELEACERLQKVLLGHESIPANLMPAVTASEALRLTLDELSGESVSPAIDEQAIDVLGWLELPLDDAPACIVTSLNEGFVPASVNVDQFLPDNLRRELGVLDNARRYARDAFALSLLVHSRPDAILIAGRRSERGDPLIPSRLLFAADEEVCANRVVRFFSRPVRKSSLVSRGPFSADRDESDFVVPRPQGRPLQVEKLRITELRTYLQSPYRFYLERVLKLQARDDVAEEISPASFGDLAHAIVREFGLSDVKDSTHPDEIRTFLEDTLEDEVSRRFGQVRHPVVDVQQALLAARLSAFAKWQAAWVEAGWTIRHVEAPGQGACLPFRSSAGTLVQLQGRMDRVDQHRETGAWVIFDYKTGDSIQDPRKTHGRPGEWRDLQLPLYRHLAAETLDVEGDVGAGLHCPLQVGRDGR